MEITSLSLVPPLLVLAIAFWAKQVLVALAAGIISGTVIITHFSLLQSLQLITRVTFNQITDLDTLYVFTFLAALGALTALINYTGGTLAYGKHLRKSLSDARSAQFSSLSLSAFLCFDDFFSSITTGCIMRPITDHFKIPRIKLAFLIDAMAAPLAILIPISSWIAMLMMQLNKAGISETLTSTTTILGDPFLIYLKTIPFIFYSILIVASTFFIVQRNISFGIMHTHEQIAQSTGNLFGGKNNTSPNSPQCSPRQGSLIDFILPIALLLSFILIILFYTGNAWFLGGTNTLAEAFTHAQIFLSLALGTLLALVASLVFFLSRASIHVSMVPLLLYEGIKPMGHVILILLAAWIFSSLMVNDLKSGLYLASLVANKVAIWLLPALCFLLAAITSISVGSSWGTIAILTPLALPMLLGFSNTSLPVDAEQIPLLFPLFGAIFAGAVAGDHISPLSSTTIMSSTSSGAYHFDHVKSQLEYATPALIGSLVGYLLCGFLTPSYGQWISLLISLACALAVTLVLLYSLNNKKTK